MVWIKLTDLTHRQSIASIASRKLYNRTIQTVSHFFKQMCFNRTALLRGSARPCSLVRPLQLHRVRPRYHQFRARFCGNARSENNNLPAAPNRCNSHGPAWLDVDLWRALCGRFTASVRVSLLRLHHPSGFLHLLLSLPSTVGSASTLEVVLPGKGDEGLAGKVHQVQDQ